ncbi:MAG: AAA family ATPase [Spirochaetaceae bacterium]
MFLQSMELMGFKSFADRTHIDFSTGISALLGPNGCGKSNIVDAVKWVLGEQSTKNMRAMKMEDVIFNGTVKRKPLNVAEVTLTISNETNILELDAPQIEIKRRLYRSGESEYYINNAQVRLKELRELFFDTGIGKTAYSILEQGKIDQVLSSRPEERRHLFEEAAGITKYKQRGHEASRKLEKTRDNIKQAQNILSEVSRSYFTLKEQAEKTGQYRDIKEKLFEIEVSLQLLKVTKLKELHQRRGDEHSKRQENLTNIEKDIKSLSEDLGDSHKEQGRLRGDLSEKQKNIYGISLEKESIKNRLVANRERDKEYSSQLGLIDEREHKYEERSQELKSEISQKRENQKELQLDLTSLNHGLEKYVTENSKNSNDIDEYTALVTSDSEMLTKYDQRKEIIIDELKNLATKITDKLQDGLKGFSLEKHNTLIDLFRKQLKLARTNPSILFKLDDDFTELLDSFPTSVLELLNQDSDFEQKKDFDKELGDIKKNIIKAKDSINRSNQEIKLINHKIEVTSELISKNKVSIAESKVKLTAIEENISIINKNLQEEQSLLSEIKKERANLAEKVKQLSLDRGRIVQNQEELVKKEKELNINIKKLEELIAKIKDSNSSKENKLNNKKESLSSIAQQIDRFNFESEHLETKVKELYEEFQEKYSIDLEEASKGIDGKIHDEVELKKSIQELRIKQKTIGQINLMAPEEFKEVSKRYNFLKDQIDDLIKADENLTKITSEIKEESTKLFFQTFEEIKKSFSIMYQRLFGGGSAELKLTDSTNILESGIEIYARPPGKSLENISLLSGGERSLTAVALLFATYSIKPSPFCILDEIDAALDERNISRFVTTLTEFAKESQFIVITHNKKTVTGAGALLGVTMQESGVSKLITMRLEHEEEK